MWGDIAIAFLLAFIVTFMITPYTIKFAKKIGAVDVPKDQRRMHKVAMPKFGGPAIILGFIFSVVYLLISMTIEHKVNLFGAEEYGMKLLGLLLGIIVIGVVCAIDDIRDINPLTKLLGQTVAAIIVVAFGIRINGIGLPFVTTPEMHEYLSMFITVCWIIGVTNAINLIDGLDGLSSGISIISSVSLLIIFVLNGSSEVSIVLITALAGALLGFLPFNFAPAKTFIGDTGSNFLGFALSIISILGMAKTYTAAVIVMPIIVLALPIGDTVFAIIRRAIKNRSIMAIFKADKGHLHHRIVAHGFTKKQTVLILYGISAIFGMFAIILMDSGIWKALSFLLIVLAACALGYKNFIDEKDSNQRYECEECKYIYNPKFGNEKDGIKSGTSFSQLPDEWVCPVCGKQKRFFSVHE